MDLAPPSDWRPPLILAAGGAMPPPPGPPVLPPLLFFEHRYTENNYSHGTGFTCVIFPTVWFGFGFCRPWILRSSDGSSLIWDITSSPRGVEPPSTRQLEF